MPSQFIQRSFQIECPPANNCGNNTFTPMQTSGNDEEWTQGKQTRALTERELALDGNYSANIDMLSFYRLTQ